MFPLNASRNVLSVQGVVIYLEALRYRAMLTGKELLETIKRLAGSSKTELVRACGYTRVDEEGKERLQFGAFDDAVLHASTGVHVGGKGTGRHLSFKARVQGNGNLLIGKAYTKEVGLEAGDEFTMLFGINEIRLIPVDGEITFEGKDAAAIEAYDQDRYFADQPNSGCEVTGPSPAVIDACSREVVAV
jgi:hypothetical protein